MCAILKEGLVAGDGCCSRWRCLLLFDGCMDATENPGKQLGLVHKK